MFLDHSSALLSANTYVGNEVDLWQRACAGVLAPDGHEQVPDAELCPTYDRLTVPLEFHVLLEESLPAK